MVRPLLVFLAAGIILLGPLTVSAATTNFFGPIVPNGTNGQPNCICPGSAPSFGCVLQTVQNAISFGVSILVIIITLMIAYSGILFMVNPTNPNQREHGRSMVTNAFIGLIIVLCAWLIVDFVMKALYNGSAAADAVGYSKAPALPWNAIIEGRGEGVNECIIPKESSPLPGMPSVGFALPGHVTGGSPSRTPIGQACSVPSSGPCSEASLAAAFGSKASEAAKICMKESTGNPQSMSKTDKLADGSPYSVGLFQINLTNSFDTKVNGKSCSAAFSGPCQGRQVVQQSGSNIGRCSQTIVDRALYTACVAEAKKPQVNIAEAKRLFDGDWGRWKNSAMACSLPH